MVAEISEIPNGRLSLGLEHSNRSSSVRSDKVVLQHHLRFYANLVYIMNGVLKPRPVKYFC